MEIPKGYRSSRYRYTTNMHYIDLPEDVRQVQITCKYIEKQIITDYGKWYLVRIMPYRTMNNIMDGTVITFSDITTAKKLEIELRKDN